MSNTQFPYNSKPTLSQRIADLAERIKTASPGAERARLASEMRGLALRLALRPRSDDPDAPNRTSEGKP